MTNPSNYKYTKEHEWVVIENRIATIGITNFGQSELGELVFVDLPEVGRKLSQGESFCVVESTKAASDVYAPVSGTVKEVNTSLRDNPAMINGSPYGDGWLIKLSDVNEADVASLMTSENYEKYVGHD